MASAAALAARSAISGRTKVSKMASMSKLTLGEWLAVARELKGWTIRDLEKRCRVSNAVISQIETGHIKEPGFHKVVRIARALGLDLNRIAETAIDTSDYGMK